MHQAIMREEDMCVTRLIVIVPQAWRSKRSGRHGVRINEMQKERRECGGEFCYLQMGNLSEYVVEVILDVCCKRQQTCGYEIEYQAKFLRHFTARLKPCAG